MKTKFKELINQAIKPTLKKVGFKKKNLNFYKRGEDLVYLINIQKSHGNAFDRLGFYINCCIYSEKIVQALKLKVLAFPKEADCHLQKRIGSISKNMPEMFLIDPVVDMSRLTSQVSLGLEEAITFFDKISDTDVFVSLLSKEGNVKRKEVFRFCIMQNRIEEAQAIANRLKANVGQERWDNYFQQEFKNILKEENVNLLLVEL